jgi:transcriptional regulator with XRE-family HTH domain
MSDTEVYKRSLIAERLKQARKLAGLSQGHVAKMLGLHRP